MNWLLKTALACCVLSWGVIVLFTFIVVATGFNSRFSFLAYAIEFTSALFLNGIAILLLLTHTIHTIRQRQSPTWICLRFVGGSVVIAIVVPVLFAAVYVDVFFRPSKDIFEAISRNRRYEVLALLEKDAELIDSTNSSGDALIHEVAKRGDVQLLEFLIRKGVNVNTRGWNGSTPLHQVAGSHSGATLMMEALIDARADLDAIDFDGRTPLHYAAQWGLQKAVRLLLDHGAHPSIKSKDGLTPLDESKRQLTVQGDSYPERWRMCIKMLSLDIGLPANVSD